MTDTRILPEICTVQARYHVPYNNGPWLVPRKPWRGGLVCLAVAVAGLWLAVTWIQAGAQLTPVIPLGVSVLSGFLACWAFIMCGLPYWLKCCPECDMKVSINARSCPHCDFKQPRRTV